MFKRWFKKNEAIEEGDQQASQVLEEDGLAEDQENGEETQAKAPDDEDLGDQDDEKAPDQEADRPPLKPQGEDQETPLMNEDEVSLTDQEEMLSLEAEISARDQTHQEDSNEALSQHNGGFFKKLFSGLDKTRKNITDRIDQLIFQYGEIDEDLFEELEEILITADIGMETTMRLIEALKAELVLRKINDAALVKAVLKDVMVRELTTDEASVLTTTPPTVMLVIGVNGAGKTTSIGKIAHLLKREGQTVLVAAADTFRAAAIDQLKVWAGRAHVDVISQVEGSDPAAVVYDAVQSAKAKKTDVLICDTAGRLQNKKNLMNELSKIFRVIEREYPHAHREVLLVLDATTGQNAIQQAKLFMETAPITGIVLTKLDGTAKGGFVFAIQSELGIPVKLIGVGEKIDDLQHFHPHDFVDALMQTASR